MISIEQRALDTKGRATGFDYLRITLASAVILWHAFTVCYGAQWGFAFMGTPWRFTVTLILPMFFALSGFLVSGSLFRSAGLITFLGLRVIRIYPALAIEVALSALILGAFLTTEPLQAYFTSKAFFWYLANVTGHIHFRLPGVFASNPIPYIVNSQLWTVPWELGCYASISVLAILGIHKRRGALLVAVSAATALLFAYHFAAANGHFDQTHGILGDSLIVSFLCGVTVYAWRETLPWNVWLFLASAALTVALLIIPGGDYLVGFPAAYATVYLGLLNPPRPWGADYSYGLYLYGFVIQQTVVALLPGTLHWYINFAISMVIATAFAAASWHFIEKPAQKLKKHLPGFEARFSTLRGRSPG